MILHSTNDFHPNWIEFLSARIEVAIAQIKLSSARIELPMVDTEIQTHKIELTICREKNRKGASNGATMQADQTEQAKLVLLC